MPAYAYFQLTHDGKTELTGSSIAQSFGAQSFTGFAIYTSRRQVREDRASHLDRARRAHKLRIRLLNSSSITSYRLGCRPTA